MFRFFKLYSLYMNSTGFLDSEEPCVCEKLPRAVLHVPVNHYNVCDLCGMIRRPPTCSSDEDEKMDVERQKLLLQRRRAEEAAHLNKAARFKVAVKGKKPQVKTHSKRNKSDNGTRTEGGGLGEAGDGDGPKEASKMDHCQEEPSAPPPSSPSPVPSGSPCEDTTFIRRRLIYDDQFVKKFIPLKGPITDPSGGAISKRSSNIWGAPNPHISRPQGPLSKDKLLGGFSSKSKGRYTESQLASQFHPFDEYEGPSEDAFIVDSSRRMLSRPNSLYIDPRPDLPNNRIGNHGSSLGRIWLSSHTIPSAPSPKIPEPPSGPFINKSPLPEEVKSDTKEIIENSDTYQLTKSEEQPENSECEDILRDLGLIEICDEKDEPTVNELANEDVFSSNKTMSDEEYSEIESKEWGAPGREPIKIGVLKASEEVEESISAQKHRTISKKRVRPVFRKIYQFKVANATCRQSIAPRNPVKVAPAIALVAKKPRERLFTRKLEILQRLQHMCTDLPISQVYCVRQLVGRLSVSYVQKQRSLSVWDITEAVNKNCQNTCRDFRHGVKSFSRFETPSSSESNPKEFNFIKQMNTKAGPDRISVIKSLPAKCSQCRRHIRNQAADSNTRKISRDSELELLKLKTGSKKRVCPVHSDSPKRFLSAHRIMNNRSENLETKKVVGKIPELKMEKTLKTFTRRFITFYKVYHMSVDLPQIHLVSYVRQLSGILSKSFVLGAETMIPRMVIPLTPQSKNKARAVWPSMKLTKNNPLETGCEKHFQEQNWKRPRSLVPEPETNQDSESERKMILAIVKHFRSIKKPLKKRSRGF